MSSIRLTTRMKEEIARNALIKSGVFTELEEVTKLKNQLALDARVIAFGGKKKTEEVDQLSSKLVAISEDGMFILLIRCSFYFNLSDCIWQKDWMAFIWERRQRRRYIAPYSEQR